MKLDISVSNAAVLHRDRRRANSELKKFKLPVDRTQAAELDIRNGKFEIAAHVRKGRSREICGDSIGVGIGNKFAMIVVADGFGPLGHVYSEAFVDRILANTHMQKDEIANRIRRDNLRLRRLVEKSARSTREKIVAHHQDEESGTTGTITIIGDDLLHGANVGDSALYLQDGNIHQRCFDYGWINKFTPDQRERVRIEHASLKDVIEFSGILDAYVGKRDLRTDQIEEHKASGKGSGALLVSDGITKNLHMMVDRESGPEMFDDEDLIEMRLRQTMIRDISGEDDINHILRGIRGARERVARLVDVTLTRCEKHPVLSSTGGGNHYICLSGDDDISAVSFNWKEVE